MLRFLVIASLVACSLGAQVKRPRLDGRIVGGSNANIEDYPYQLSFEYQGSHMCGASIVNENYIVTAAHCVDGVSASSVQFRAGSSNRGSGGSVHKASSLLANPNFDYYSLDSDIAVGKVSTPFSFGTGVQPIPLATSEPADGTNVQISGWGTTSSGGSLPSRLQVVTVPIVSRQKCNAAYGDITDTMICAGLDEGGKDSCQGDSGGPLVSNGQLAGIVSWGAGCAQAGYPGVYSNVAALKSFVDNNTK